MGGLKAAAGRSPMPHTFPTAGIPNGLVGRTPWSVRDALVPPVREESIGCDDREADQGGRPRTRASAPLFVLLPGNGKCMWH
jgi:hypothetical protein